VKQSSSSTVEKMCSKYHEHKHASVLVIIQLRHQSATTPSLATHAADAVIADQSHEPDSDAIFTSHVKQITK